MDCGLGADRRRNPALRPTTSGLRGQNAQNKPNSRRPGYPTVPIPCRLYQTKPIPASRNAAWGSGFPSHPSVPPVDCAKQTQFRQREKKRQVLCEKGFMVNRTVYRPRQNKANLRAKPGGTRPQGRGTAGKCAKRTRFQAASGTPPPPPGPPASPLGQRQLYKQSQLPGATGRDKCLAGQELW
jgi:hypothetical protein